MVIFGQKLQKTQIFIWIISPSRALTKVPFKPLTVRALVLDILVYSRVRSYLFVI